MYADIYICMFIKYGRIVRAWQIEVWRGVISGWRWSDLRGEQPRYLALRGVS